MDPRMEEMLRAKNDYPDIPEGGWENGDPAINLNIYARRLYADLLNGRKVTVD